MKNKNLFKAIIVAGLTAGLFDITAAFIQFMIASDGKRSPLIILKYIASAVFGKDRAYSGGVLMEALGLFFHFLIAMLFTVFFFFIYPKFKFLSRNIFITGLGYGIFAWLVMNLIVVPASSLHKFPSSFGASAIEGMLILMFVFGLPIALFAKKYYSKN